LRTSTRSRRWLRDCERNERNKIATVHEWAQESWL
jgi:hypothetical protein